MNGNELLYLSQEAFIDVIFFWRLLLNESIYSNLMKHILYLSSTSSCVAVLGMKVFHFFRFLQLLSYSFPVYESRSRMKTNPEFERFNASDWRLPHIIPVSIGFNCWYSIAADLSKVSKSSARRVHCYAHASIKTWSTEEVATNVHHFHEEMNDTFLFEASESSNWGIRFYRIYDILRNIGSVVARRRRRMKYM